MKKKILSLVLVTIFICSLIGCGKGEQDFSKLTPEDYEPECYTFKKGKVNEDELPDGTYYIVKRTKKHVKYYPIFTGCETSITSISQNKGADPSRIVWANYNLDEGLIPTLTDKDELIYKSHTFIPTTYALEKFFDLGYTFGVAGLTADISGNYKYVSANGEYSNGNGIIHSTSDAAGFNEIEAESIYFVSINGEKVTYEDLNVSGAINGLELMKKYKCDIREGTIRDDVTLTANIRLFSSAETYTFSDFEFITPYIAKINIPEYATTGYYSVNGIGFFKYEKEGSTNNNETIYTYDESGQLNGALIDGVLKKFDESGFIIDYEEPKDENDESQNKPLVARLKNDKGYFGKEYYISYIYEPKTNSNGRYYNMDAISMDRTDTITLRYYTKDKDQKMFQVGNSYNVDFLLSKSSIDSGVGVIKHMSLAGTNVDRPLMEDGVEDYPVEDLEYENSEDILFEDIVETEETTNEEAEDNTQE